MAGIRAAGLPGRPTGSGFTLPPIAFRTPIIRWKAARFTPISVEDGTVQQLTTRKGPDTDPVPGPGGKKIAYLGHDWKFQSYTVNHLYLMDADGSNAKNLTA